MIENLSKIYAYSENNDNLTMAELSISLKILDSISMVENHKLRKLLQDHKIVIHVG